MTIEYGVCGEVGISGETTFVSGVLTIASGGSGTLATIPAPPTGQKIRLSLLLSTGAGNENGVTVNSGGVAIMSSLNLDNAGDAFTSVGAARISPEGCYQFIDGAKNANMTIVKDTGSTTNALSYAYQYIG